MIARSSSGLPVQLTDRSTRVLRPRDAADTYAYPAPEFRRLTRRGLLRRLATGYYVIVPQDRVGDAHWRPSISAAALGIATADYGRDRVALMGTSAARHHGLVPRELSTAVVAVPSQRPTLDLLGGRVRFVRRDTSRLDLERISTELGDGWVTTIEQTALDLIAHSSRSGLSTPEVTLAVDQALPRLDLEVAEDLARAQRKTGALRTLRSREEEADA